MAPESQGLNCT